MTTTIHPWTMYEVARYRDEERILRAQAAMLALKAREETRPERLATEGSEGPSWLQELRDHLHPLRWAQSHHLAPHHAHRARHG
jgi:hypothetical protein